VGRAGINRFLLLSRLENEKNRIFAKVVDARYKPVPIKSALPYDWLCKNSARPRRRAENRVFSEQGLLTRENF
jgi:hypothetical protein